MSKEIKLTKGKVAVVDDEDYEWLNSFRWHASWSGNRFYVCRRVTENKKSRIVYMHRFIMSDVDGMVVDHSDGDSLNNTRANLRHVTRSKNNVNCIKKSKSNNFKGVTFRKSLNKWIAQCHDGKTTKYLGMFTTEQEAHECFKSKHLELHGEYSNEAR